jgi:hypothetical protein
LAYRGVSPYSSAAGFLQLAVDVDTPFSADMTYVSGPSVTCTLDVTSTNIPVLVYVQPVDTGFAIEANVTKIDMGTLSPNSSGCSVLASVYDTLSSYTDAQLEEQLSLVSTTLTTSLDGYSVPCNY